MSKKNSAFITYAPYPALIMLIALFFIPLLLTLSQAFFKDGRLTFSIVSEAFSNPYNLKVLAFTFKQAILSTLLSLLIGLPGAYILARFSFHGKKLLRAICTVPFVLPPILVVLGFVIFYGNSGFLNKLLMALFNLSEPPLKILYSFQAIIIAHSFYNFPVAMNMVSTALEQLDENCDKASRTLGASSLRTFLSVTLPRLIPSILSAATLIFLFCFTSFAVILVLGGGPQFTTIEVEIYNQAKRSMNLGSASALSIMSMTVCIAFLALNTIVQRHAAAQSRIGATSLSTRRPRLGARILVVLYIVLLILFVLAPIASVLIRSVLSSSTRSGAKHISFELYRRLTQGSSLQAIANSLTIALAASIVSIIMGLALCISIRRRRSPALEIICMLPMSISTVIIGLGYYIISRLSGQGMSYMLIVLAHVIITLPFVIRTIMPIYRSMPENITNAALTLGCTMKQAFLRIELPLLRSAILTSFSFAFAISIGEMNATLMLSSNTIQTIPVVIYRLINSYNYQGACALGSILILVCFLVFLISEAAKKRSPYA